MKIAHLVKLARFIHTAHLSSVRAYINYCITIRKSTEILLYIKYVNVDGGLGERRQKHFFI